MTQTSADNMTTSSLQVSQKLQKKQAKRESKMRLEVEQARGDLQKAEQKIAKAQVDFEVASARDSGLLKKQRDAHPRVTMKARTTSTQPPSPLRMAICFSEGDAYWTTLVAALTIYV